MNGLSDDQPKSKLMFNVSSKQAPDEEEKGKNKMALKYLDPAVLDMKLHSLNHGSLEDWADQLVSPALNSPQNQALILDTIRILLSQYYHTEIKTNETIFDLQGFQSAFPYGSDAPLTNDDYRFTSFPRDAKGELVPFPPHLDRFPHYEKQFQATDMFDQWGLAELNSTLMIIPGAKDSRLWKKILGAVTTIAGRIGQWIIAPDGTATILQNPNMQMILDYSRTIHKSMSQTDIHEGKCMDKFNDWYSDRRFADQAFTGTDPTTIKRVPKDLYQEFLDAAARGGYKDWTEALPTCMLKKELFVDDCSWFRKAVGAQPHEELVDKKKGDVHIWACASVTLYRLQDNGKLHPVAIVLDYKGSMRDSVTIFNQAKEALDRRAPEQKDDWPWRYAKMCAQVSSYIRHEVQTHLIRAHFAQEALIVATKRSFDQDHMVYRLLQPHWYMTLSINATARSLLVPTIIEQVIGFKKDQLHSFIHHAWTTMNYQEGYVPKDLELRGFPNTVEGLDDRRYRDYAYAKGALLTWNIIERYVRTALLAQYNQDEADAEVAADPSIARWCFEVQTNAHIPTFPTIKKFDDLVKAITMSIHIAVPFHSAVNYLQNFYQGFVPSRPPSLAEALPQTLDELRMYQEDHLVQSLPMKESQKYQWLLALQVPWLLSFKAGEDHTLLSFAKSQYRMHLGSGPENEVMRKASDTLIHDLESLQTNMDAVNKKMHRGSVPYTVLNPGNAAVSILI